MGRERQVRESQYSREEHGGSAADLLPVWYVCRDASSLLLSFVAVSLQDVPGNDEARGYTSDRDILKSRALGEGPEMEVAARRCVVSTRLP